MRRFAVATCIALVAAFAPSARAAAPLTLTVDAREVARDIVHVRLEVPVAGRPAKLVFPKWVPGQHAPANPVVDLAMLQADAGGKRIAWERDPVDLFAFTFAVPPGASTMTLRYDALLSPGQATPRLALINWNPTLLYPSGAKIAQQIVHASLLLPAGWQGRTSLDGAKQTGDRMDFAPVTIERLFDSPVLAGANVKTLALGPLAELDVASDAPAPPSVNAKVQEHFSALVDEATALFGSHHWRAPYRFLITATDAIGYTGLEHHESSWNGVDTETLATEAACKRFAGDLLTHEFTHSWNGKYRRPAGLYRDDYQADETTDLLWVYEGLTEYYSDVLAARAGFWTPADYRAALATKYAYLDAETGRATRPLADTTFQGRLTGGRGAGFAAARRAAQEYYDEGELMWLEADTLIRERTGERRSLDDFARSFFGGSDGAPSVVPYTRTDVVAALNAVLASDWEAFFRAHIDLATAHPPLDGITRGGYAVQFAAKPPDANPSSRIGNAADWRYSLGARIETNGTIRDVVPGSPAAKAGLVPGMTLVAVDARRYAAAALTAAVERANSAHAPIVLLVNDRQTFATKSVEYDGGIRLPLLARAGGRDRLADIVRARAAKSR
ncbi:MAG: M61 family peptidase [Candidatus Velthaea sp.]